MEAGGGEARAGLEEAEQVCRGRGPGTPREAGWAGCREPGSNPDCCGALFPLGNLPAGPRGLQDPVADLLGGKTQPCSGPSPSQAPVPP